MKNYFLSDKSYILKYKIDGKEIKVFYPDCVATIPLTFDNYSRIVYKMENQINRIFRDDSLYTNFKKYINKEDILKLKFYLENKVLINTIPIYEFNIENYIKNLSKNASIQIIENVLLRRYLSFNVLIIDPSSLDSFTLNDLYILKYNILNIQQKVKKI